MWRHKNFGGQHWYNVSQTVGVNFIILLAQSTYGLVIIIWCHSVSPTKLPSTLLVCKTRKYAQLFYTVRTSICASKMGINLLSQKLLVERWWNWPLSQTKSVTQRTDFIFLNLTHLLSVTFFALTPRFASESVSWNRKLVSTESGTC